jgi:hypothetical protein
MEVSTEIDNTDHPAKKVSRICTSVRNPKTALKQQLMNVNCLTVVMMWKETPTPGTVEIVPYANKVQSNIMETGLKMEFALFHAEGIIFNIARNFNFDGGFSQSLLPYGTKYALFIPKLTESLTMGQWVPWELIIFQKQMSQT